MVIPISRKLSSKMCLLSPGAIQYLLMTHLTYDYGDERIEIDQAELAVALTDFSVEETRRRCPDVMKMRLYDDEQDFIVTVQMPRITFEEHTPIYLRQHIMCEIMANKYQNWHEFVSQVLSDLFSVNRK